ncbi:hypothetical protein [Paenibacillus tyrfis]|uniref:hypothetical protein n=1 Tax=Paenibacillus tyrfis TaxID=1501230 RepID=UPI001377C54F|nr:hypothetical protein [Paenibacillus tyrfis]
MNEYAISLKQTLTSLIREMSAAPAPYVKNPEKDFTRKKKLPLTWYIYIRNVVTHIGGG